MRFVTVMLPLALLAVAGCATQSGTAGVALPDAPSSSSASVTAPGPTSAEPLSPALSPYGRTWYLQSVTENGRTWAPLPDRPPTLTFLPKATAESDDGGNQTEWQAVVDATTVSWKQGISTAAGEPETVLQVDSTLGAALSGATAWSRNGDLLTILGAHSITLTYGTVRPQVPAQVSGVGVFLNAGHVPQPGESYDLLPGRVVVRNAAHKVVAAVDLSPYDDGETLLPPGSYEVSGTTAGGDCVAAPAVATLGGITEVTLGCPSS